MKKIVFLMVLIAVSGIVFAGEILPDLYAYAVSRIDGDAELLSLYPNTAITEQKLNHLRQGERSDLVAVEWIIGPSPVPISSAVIEMQKHQARVSLASSVGSFVRGEVALLGINEDLSARIVSEVSASIVFAETLRNNREELRIEYRYKTVEGVTKYGVSFWLVVDKKEIRQEIVEKAQALSSGSAQPKKDIPVEPKKTAIAQRSTAVVKSAEGGDWVKEVEEMLNANERIQRYREENKRLLSFDEDE
jgi:cell fate (sporulation/competence/biofilm development) regulator YlbF (YheA/YmcA/DUF963 family)